MAQAILQHLNNGLFLSSTNVLVSLPISTFRSKFSIKSSPISKYSFYSMYLVHAKSNHISSHIKSRNNITYFFSIIQDIEAYLKRVNPIREPYNVFEPMHHLTYVGPSSMGPTLCVATCELFGGDRAQALQVASALYVMKAAAQVHDYICATNHRRAHTQSKPIHHEFRAGIELQIGDGLFSFGYELLAELNDPNKLENSSKILQIITEVSRAMGSQGLVEGQFKKAKCETMDDECQKEWLMHMYKKKYGEFHACSAVCGAIIGDANDKEIEKLRKFGLYVGTMQGILNGNRNKDNEMIRIIQNLKELALIELESFSLEKIKAISSFVNVYEE